MRKDGELGGIALLASEDEGSLLAIPVEEVIEPGPLG